ncbi:MAG: hypothetical protein WAN36_02660 [Calditrichia bacterium]
MSKSNPIQHRLEYAGYLFLEKMIGVLPQWLMETLANGLTFLSFRLLKIRRRVALQNIATAFPGKSAEWHFKIAKQSYHHFSLMILEFMKMAKWEPADIPGKICCADLMDVPEKTHNGNGVIIASGHFGNWEMAMAYFYTLGIRSAVIQQRQFNRLVDNRMKALREKWGMKIVYPRGAVKACAAELQKGVLVALLGDQDAGGRGEFVPFFGQMSSTHIGAAVLHLRTGAPLYFAASVRREDNKYEIILERIPDVFPAEINSENIRMIIGEFNRRLEKTIRENPGQYFWMHRRWKTPFSAENQATSNRK